MSTAPHRAPGRCLRGLSVARAAARLTTVALDTARRDHGAARANGAGKSSLVLAVGGLLRPGAGPVLLGDATSRAAGPSDARSGVAIVPEGRRLLPELTVEDNLRVATYALG